MTDIVKHSEYKNWLDEMKSRIKNSQIKAALSVNKELIALYWDLGKQISAKQQKNGWGSQVVNQLSRDLCNEFTGSTGFSRSNLYAMRQFYEIFTSYSEIVHQVGGQMETTQILETVHQVGGQIEEENYLPQIVERYCFNLTWKHIKILKSVEDFKR